MEQQKPAKSASGVVSRIFWLKTKLMLLALVGLVALNVATVLSAGFHDLMYLGVRKVLLLAGDAVADRVTRHSKTVDSEERVRKETRSLREQKAKADADLVDERARHTNTSARLADEQAKGEAVRSQKSRVDEELRVEKARHADTTRQLADERVRASSAAERLDDLQAKHLKNSSTAKDVAGRVHARLAKGVARNTASIPAESIPYIGIGVVLSMTALDIYDACETMKDINGLLVKLEQGVENPDLCGTKLPTKQQVVERMRQEWAKSLDYAAAQARQVRTEVPVPQVRLPTFGEVRGLVCPLMSFSGWC